MLCLCLVVLVCMLLLVLLVIWLMLVFIDMVVCGSGCIVVFEYNQVIQYLEGGIVLVILVCEGVVVRKGQILILIVDVCVNVDFGEGCVKIFGLCVKIVCFLVEVVGVVSLQMLVDFDYDDFVV